MPFPIKHLRAHGFSEEAIAAWRSRGIENLLPLQEKALLESGFLHGKNLLALAPTAAGKTLLAEIAILKTLEQNRKAIYLVPTKALAEEKYRIFSDTFRPLGYRVLAATRERPESDAFVLSGRFDLLVAVYEKMKAYLVAQPEFLGQVALVAADEVQTLGEAGRGATIDLLLTKIRRSPYACRFLGLSAVLGEDAGRLARWLDCELLHYEQRPVELREGVYDIQSGVFHYRAFNSGEQGEERLLPLEEKGTANYTLDEPPDFRREWIFQLVRHLVLDAGEQALVFVPTRYVSRNWAHHWVNEADLPAAENALEELKKYEDSCSRDLLRQTLQKGAAFHNADLSWDLRALVEEYFNRGEIRLLFSTSTLGEGVNLTGRNVLHVPAMVQTDAWTGRHVFAALSRSRFRNQGGRGARFSIEQAPGRSMLVGRNRQECLRLLRDYALEPIETLEPRIDPAGLEVHVLDLVASRVAQTQAELATFFFETFSGRLLWRAEEGAIGSGLDDAIGNLLQRELIREEGERLVATGFGEVAAATGLQPATIEMLAKWLRSGPRHFPDELLEALVLFAVTPDGRDFAAGSAARHGAVWVESVRERLPHYQFPEEETGLGEALFPPGGFSRESIGDLRKALALDAWIGPRETRAIEEEFHIMSGTLGNLASHFAWIAQGAASLAGALAMEQAIAAALDVLAVRLVLGCGTGGAVLAPLRVPGLCRDYMRGLLEDGCDTLEDLAAASVHYLERFMPKRVAEDLQGEVRRVLRWQASSPARPQEAPSPAVTAVPEVTSPPGEVTRPLCRLEIHCAGTGKVLWDGREVRLSPLPFAMLVFLARRPGIGASYEEIEEALWPDTHVERQQIHNHRRKLVDALGRVMPADTAKRLVRVEARRGLLLDLPPEAIRLEG